MRPLSSLNAHVGYLAYREILARGGGQPPPEWHELSDREQLAWQHAAAAIAQTADARSREERSAPHGRCERCHAALVPIGTFDRATPGLPAAAPDPAVEAGLQPPPPDHGTLAFACPYRAEEGHNREDWNGGITVQSRENLNLTPRRPR